LGVKLVAAILLAICWPVAGLASNPEWTLVRSAQFEVYSQSGERDGRSALLWFEQLHAFFAQAGLRTVGERESDRPVRVIGFRSAKEYAAFRLRPTADAYFVGGEAADYIVMPGLGAEEFGIASHEYAHLVLHSLGVQLPPWLAEGLAEVFSTLRIGEQGCLIGGDLPGRTLVLQQRRWWPLADLLALPADSPLRASRKEGDIFYAESWALTNMLVFSPAYAGKFNGVFNAMASGPSNVETIEHILRKPIGAIMADLRTWAQRPRTAATFPAIRSVHRDFEVSRLTRLESDLMLADLLLATGDWERAEAAYRSVANERRNDSAIAMALGTIALRRGDTDEAREQWKRAMDLGVQDARLCYQYAILAEDASVSPDEIDAALRRAIKLKPDFDDARYKLALLESNRGHYEAALEQLRSMLTVAAARRYAYWTAMASALTETDQRDEAKKAAAKAMMYAVSGEERTAASRLAYAADTDLTVQVSHDASGNLRMITARKPHGSNDWNPFIEPGDHIRSVEGRIQKVECVAGRITGFSIEIGSTAVELELPDPARVLIDGGAPEFVCGAEDGRKVAIQYAAFDGHAAADGVLRGMKFK
jgi:hypothetical protein